MIFDKKMKNIIKNALKFKKIIKKLIKIKKFYKKISFRLIVFD